MRENKPRLTLAAAYIRRELGHLYQCGFHKTRNSRINGSLMYKNNWALNIFSEWLSIREVRVQVLG